MKLLTFFATVVIVFATVTLLYLRPPEQKTKSYYHPLPEATYNPQATVDASYFKQ